MRTELVVNTNQLLIRVHIPYSFITESALHHTFRKRKAEQKRQKCVSPTKYLQVTLLYAVASAALANFHT